jgi:glycine/D-amino acid oxidase-like deaminating enzyme
MSVSNKGSVAIIGGGIVGSWQALMFARAGYDVCLFERDHDTMTQATGYWAGGMLAVPATHGVRRGDQARRHAAGRWGADARRRLPL